MFCCVLRCVHSSFAIILMGKKELAALLSLSFWYEGHPIKNETFFIVRKSVCVFS